MSVRATNTITLSTDGDRRVRRLSRWWLVPLGVPIGAVIGVIARGWMRLVTDDPEFTWSGTVFIVVAFAIAGIGHAIAWAARASATRRRWSTVARIVAAVLTMPLFTGAGAIMLPTVAAGSMARWRSDWAWPVRLLLTLVAGAMPVIVLIDVFDGGMTGRRLIGSALFVVTYASIVVSMRSIVAPLDDGWRIPRAARIGIAVCAGLALLVIAVLIVGPGAA